MLRSASRGTTLAELVVVLLLVGIGLSLGTRVARGFRDRWAVESARRATAVALRRTRAEAVGRGGARLRIDTAGGVLTLEGTHPPRALGSLAAEFGVRTRIGNRATRTFRYDPAGIGRVANGTVVFRRGRAESRLVVSLLGRVRP